MFLLLLFFSIHSQGQQWAICHAEPEQSKYRYAGYWEKNEEGKLVCNYWQFLSEAELEESRPVGTAVESVLDDKKDESFDIDE